MLSDEEISPFYDAVIEATEEAILNALVAAQTMTGRDGNTVHALEPELLVEVLRQFAGGGVRADGSEGRDAPPR
jgi:D-aminopeptidase